MYWKADVMDNIRIEILTMENQNKLESHEATLVRNSAHQKTVLGKLGPGAQLSGAQLSTPKKWQIGPRTVGPEYKMPHPNPRCDIQNTMYTIPNIKMPP